MLSRKDYVKLAAALDSAVVSGAEIQSTGLIISKLIEVFREDNPRFDSARFIKACGFDTVSVRIQD